MNPYEIPEGRSLVRVVESDEVARSTLTRVLTEAGWECAVYGSPEEFFVEDAASDPGCLVTSFELSSRSGLEFQLELLARDITLPVVFCSEICTVPKVVRAMKQGAVSVVEKKRGNDYRLLTAVREACELGGARPNDTIRAKRAWLSLTTREMEVGLMISRGLRNREIAERLGGLSTKTVQAHSGLLYKKLHVKNRRDAARWIHEHRALIEQA